MDPPDEVVPLLERHAWMLPTRRGTLVDFSSARAGRTIGDS
jgi:hypothetical protein